MYLIYHVSDETVTIMQKRWYLI